MPVSAREPTPRCDLPMQTWNCFPRLILAVTLLLALCAGMFAPRMGKVEAKPLAVCPGGIITQWTFENVVTPSIGNGVLSSGTGLNPPNPPPYTLFSGTALSFSSWNTVALDPTAYVEFQVDTSGRSDIFFSFDYRSTATGPTIVEMHYSTDGTNFTSFITQALTNDSSFYTISIDLTSVTALNNNANSKFRIYAYNATGAGGTLAIDNVTVSEYCPPPAPTETFTPSLTFTPSETGSPTETPTITNTPTNTPTITNTPSITPSPTNAGLLSVLINEVAWSGTSSTKTADEWIELYNTTGADISLNGWRLTIDKGDTEEDLVTFDINDDISAGDFFLLAHESSGTYDIFNDVVEDKPFTASLPNTGTVVLRLYDSHNNQVDTANSGKGSGWYAGSSTTYSTMERRGKILDGPSAWFTFGGTPFAHNRDNASVRGTPKKANWAVNVTPTSSPVRTATKIKTATPTRPPTLIPIPPRPIINEILPRPGYDWNQDGKADVLDEFIEIKNLTVIDMNLSGWKLDVVGGPTFPLPNVTLKPGEHIVFYSSQTNLLLSDGGATVRLLNSSGKIYDAYTYTFAREEDKSICRLPDGNVFNGWYEDCTPTPGTNNTREGTVPSSPNGNTSSPVCDLPDTIPSDFFLAECRGYGANIWNPYYWDQLNEQDKIFIPETTDKWKSFVE